MTERIGHTQEVSMTLREIAEAAAERLNEQGDDQQPFGAEFERVFGVTGEDAKNMGEPFLPILGSLAQQGMIAAQTHGDGPVEYGVGCMMLGMMFGYVMGKEHAIDNPLA
jgi:hypothetical protein